MSSSGGKQNSFCFIFLVNSTFTPILEIYACMRQSLDNKKKSLAKLLMIISRKSWIFKMSCAFLITIYPLVCMSSFCNGGSNQASYLDCTGICAKENPK